MGIVLDVIILAILALSIFMGYKKGLIGVILKLFAFVIAIVVTWILFTPVSNLIINNTNLDDNIKNIIIEKGVVEQKQNEEKNDNDVGSFVQEYVSKSVNDKKNEMVKSSADIIAEKTVAIIVAIGLFIVVRIALILLKFIAEGIAELPIIKQFNELGGTIYGIIRGLFVIYTILAICFVIMSINNIEFLSNLINTSILSKFLYEHNFILDIIF